uniref:Uncharacterized protein n=1 Tax=viral metagenome TaxID=1070528 RepID=A0A6C0I3T4_9ZZZZ
MTEFSFRIENVSDIREDLHERIRQIPYYSDNFSPILEITPIGLGNRETQELLSNTKLDSNEKMILCKTRYIGIYDLRTSLDQYKSKHPKLFDRYLKKCCYDLLNSANLLQEANINDIELTEEVIICRDVDGKPIIEIKESKEKMTLSVKKRIMNLLMAIVTIPTEMESIFEE